MAQIPEMDKTAMNELYTSEFNRIATKLKAAGRYDSKEEGPTPSDAQAFKDHADLISELEAVLKEDSRDGFSPNDEILD